MVQSGLSAWQRGKKLSMLLDKRFYAPTLAARELLAKGKVGELVLAGHAGPRRLPWPTSDARQETYGGVSTISAFIDVDLLL